MVSKLPAGGGAVSRQNLSKFNLEETRDGPVEVSIVVSIVVSGVVVVMVFVVVAVG